jgi:hypothetical protein
MTHATLKYILLNKIKKMKKITLLMLTVTALLFSFKSEAQTLSGIILTDTSEVISVNGVSVDIHPDYLDTVECTMLITNDLQFSAFSIKGYEVRKCHPYYSSWDCGQTWTIWDIKYLLEYYLDNRKQKLTDNSIVWLSK